MYSLNYDRYFKVLLEKIGVSVFEGFDCGEFIPGKGLNRNIKKIIIDDNSHIHYNLHGFSFWEIEARDYETQLPSVNIKLKPIPQLNINGDESSVIQMEKGKTVLISNIVTGYQKLQKTSLAPFKQMQTAFDKDCLLSDEIIIVGYSFGDSHINSSIKTALKYNPNIKLTFIDPAYSEKEEKKGYDYLVSKWLYVLPEIFNTEITNPIYTYENNCAEYFNGIIKVYSIGFDDFLKLKTN